MKTIRGTFVLLALVACCRSASATPVVCSWGYQDSTCLTPQQHSPTPPPACQSGPGWTTISSAVWQGSHWSQPACNYQAPPSCPGGYQQTSAPWWNGSGWVGLGCTLPPPPQATLSDQLQACATVAAAYGKFLTPSAFVGPQSETTNQVANDINSQPPPRICEAPGSGFGGAAHGDWPPSNGPYDVYKFGFGTLVEPDFGNPDAGYVYGVSTQLFACMLNPGTTQVVGFILSQSQNATGGPCGGGH